MHYNLHYEITPEVSKVITEAMLRIYDEYKDDEKIFSKDKPKENKTKNYKEVLKYE